MTSVTNLHRQAMNLTDTARILQRTGSHEDAKLAFQEAYTLEAYAAEKEITQPSRSILFRSAAWLALHAELFAESERLAALGLASTNVPDWLKEELREVAEHARAALLND